MGNEYSEPITAKWYQKIEELQKESMVPLPEFTGTTTDDAFNYVKEWSPIAKLQIKRYIL